MKQQFTKAYFGSIVKAMEMKILILFLTEIIFCAEDRETS